MKKLFILLFVPTICSAMVPKPPLWTSDDEIGDPRSLSSSVELSIEFSDDEEESKNADIKTTNKQNTDTQSTRVVTALRAQHELENKK